MNKNEQVEKCFKVVSKGLWMKYKKITSRKLAHFEKKKSFGTSLAPQIEAKNGHNSYILYIFCLKMLILIAKRTCLSLKFAVYSILCLYLLPKSMFYEINYVFNNNCDCNFANF